MNAVGSANRYEQMAAVVQHSQDCIQSTLSSSRSFQEFSKIIARKQHILDQYMGSAIVRELDTSAAIMRSFALVPDLLTVTKEIFDLAEEKSLTDSADFISDGDKWASFLLLILNYIENLIESSEVNIDHRVILRFITYIFPILLSVYAVIDNKISVDKVIARIDNSEKVYSQINNTLEESMEQINSRLDVLSDRLEGLPIDGDAEIFYVARRFAPLSEKKRYHGTLIAWIIPGQEVQAVTFSKKWMKVIAYDIRCGGILTGWVLKKYFRRVNNTSRAR